MIIKEYKGKKSVVTITRYDNDKDYCYCVKCLSPNKPTETYWFGINNKNDALAYAEGLAKEIEDE